MEDYPGCVSRSWIGIRSSHAHDLHHLVAQMGSFLVPIVVMLAIPLTALGVMPGFYLLNAMASQTVEATLTPSTSRHCYDWNDRIVGNRHA